MPWWWRWGEECLSSPDSGQMCRSIVDTDSGGLRWIWRGTWWTRWCSRAGATGRWRGPTGSRRVGSQSSWGRFEATLPNEGWQSDVTHWRLADRTEVEI